MNMPQNYSNTLKAASDEHHEALFFGWKIAEGLRNQVQTRRLKHYADWFFRYYMKPHLEIEKNDLFPLLSDKNVRVKRALANHRRLIRLFTDENDVFKSLNRIEDEIGRYIRFEERVLYKEIQSKVSPEKLEEVRQKFQAIPAPKKEWDDKFWEE